MIERVSLKLLDFVVSHTTIDDDLAEVYKYGIEISISTALNILLTIILSFVLGDVLCGLIFLICMVLIRSYCGGYHADSYFKCNLTMIILFSITYCVSRVLVCFDIARFYIMILVLTLGFIPIFAFSPVRNKHKELTEEKYTRCRVISFILYITIGMMGLFLISVCPFYGSIIIVTLTEVSVMILIEIFRQRRKKDEGERSNS